MSEPLFNALFDQSERRPETVSALTTRIKNTLEARFASVWVEGEISNFKVHSSGHWYFTIKDESAQLRAKCFRSTKSRIRFRPADGLHVRARGKLSVYEARGDYELIVEALDPIGAGALRIAFEQLRDRLQAEGLFAKELKRPLPLLPRRVGVVTSPTGAAIRDILNVITRRTRTVHVLFSPARVQGEHAGSDIARAIRTINIYHERAQREGRTGDLVDVLIVGRGGGSTEDLWAFNQEEVARAIRSSSIPVISAVGHETDFTIADFAADLRAATPSAAAELVAAQEDQICSTLDELARNLTRSIRFKIINARTRVQERALSQVFDEVRARMRSARTGTDSATHRLQLAMNRQMRQSQARMETVQFRLSPARAQTRLANMRRRLESAYNGCASLMDSHLEEARTRFGLAATSLDALSPLAVLQRGYAIAQDGAGKLLRDARSLSTGDPLSVRLAKGSLDARVERTHEE